MKATIAERLSLGDEKQKKIRFPGRYDGNCQKLLPVHLELRYSISGKPANSEIGKGPEVNVAFPPRQIQVPLRRMEKILLQGYCLSLGQCGSEMKA